MSRRTITLAALLAPALLTASPATEAHSGAVRVHLGFGVLVVDPPLLGRLEIGYPAHIHGQVVPRHDHGSRVCRLDHRHRVHRHDHRRYHQH